MGGPWSSMRASFSNPQSEGSIVLWLPGECAGGYKHWERVVAAARAPIATGQGVCSIAAASVPVRQRLGGSLGKLLRGLRGSRADRTWTVPGGELAEQCGARRADLRLAWAEDAAAPLDEPQIKALWPDSRESRAIGPNLYFVAGVAPNWTRGRAAGEDRRRYPGRGVAAGIGTCARRTGPGRLHARRVTFGGRSRH